MGGWLSPIFKAREDKRQAGTEQLGFQLTVGTLLAVSYTELQVSHLRIKEVEPSTSREPAGHVHQLTRSELRVNVFIRELAT